MTDRQAVLPYRSDIDSLRAVAVMSVILYHMKVPGFSGGFVGVDVFFVISGYLITAQLMTGMTIGEFYQRRVRRIIPAFALMASVSALAVSLLFSSKDALSFTKSLIAAFLFSSNIYFWRDTHYFSDDAELEPLLHTWSLSVEEQFYLIFPVIFSLFRANRSQRAFVFVVIAVVASFALSELAMRNGKTIFAFYMMPTRAWELLIGAAVALRPPHVPTTRARSLVAGVGLALILGAVFLFSAKLPFPGLYAAVPVLGAAAVIIAGQSGRHALSPLLEIRPVVFIGLISYALYLWHWPVLAIMRYTSVSAITASETLLALAITVVAAVLSWKLVERPLRSRSLPLWRGLFPPAVFLGTGALALSGASLRLWPSFFSAEAATIADAKGSSFRCSLVSTTVLGRSQFCALTPGVTLQTAEVLLWGDSHAEMYAPALTAAGAKQAGLVLERGCAPVQGWNASPHCALAQEENLRRIIAAPTETVILALNWNQYGTTTLYNAQGVARSGDDFRAIGDGLVRAIRLLVRAGKHVIVVDPIPVPGFDLPSQISREVAFRNGVVSPIVVNKAEFEWRVRDVSRLLMILSNDGTIRVIKVSDQICGKDSCYFMRGKRPLFGDGSHLTTSFSRSLQAEFRVTLQPDR